MESSDVPYYQPIQSLGTTYDLTHLEPFTIQFFSQNAKKNLSIHITFSNHCFSEKLSNNPSSTHTLVDDTQGRERVFCPIRYNLSQDLPTIIKRLNDPKVKVRETQTRRNWCYTIQVQVPQGPYHIFFEIRKNKNKNKKQDINMVVESAYHETTKKPAVIGRMGFYILCTNVYLGKKTSTKR